MISALYNTTMDIVTKTLTDDGLGGIDQTYTPVASGIDCRIRTLAYQAKTQNEKGEFIISHKIWCPANTSIDPETQMVKQDGNYFKVMGIIPAYTLTEIDHIQLQLLKRPEDQ